MTWDSIVMVDWSGGGDRGLRPAKDAIWIGEARQGVSKDPLYCRNRVVAEAWLSERIAQAINASERLLFGFDFPFGYPKGFARAVTGSDDTLALWADLAKRLPTSEQGRERVQVAADLNALFPGDGPFWFNPLKDDIAGLPRQKPAAFPLREWRAAERRASGTFSCFQIGGAGSVGSQALTGIATLERLRSAFADKVRIWPFEPLEGPVAFVEIWPSLIADAVSQGQHEGEIKDAAQVRILAEAISRLTPKELNDMLSVDAPEEGWIFGLGFETTLTAAARQGTLRNDCFALPRGTMWTPVDDALALLRERLAPVTPIVEVTIEEAAGRALAEEIHARRPNPPSANSAVDGYGLSGGLAPGLHHIDLIEERAAAGAPFSGTLPEGKAIRILTGASLPDGVTTVVLEEDCRVSHGQISVEGPLKLGANARRAGEDVETGQAILAKGRKITPADIALLAATGHGRVSVHDRLRVGVLSTGDELRPAGTAAAASETVDANGPMLAALLRGLGHDVVPLGICPDDRGALRATLDEASTRVDAILTSGGASAGEEDHVSALLTETGSMALWRLALKPGRPMALGLWNGCPVFGLPGNPVAAMVCTLVFARPALALLAGRDWAEPEAVSVPAAFTKRKKAGRREYLRARLRAGRAEVFASEGSGRISGLSWAEGLVELPDEAVDVETGTLVRYLPFSGLLQ